MAKLEQLGFQWWLHNWWDLYGFLFSFLLFFVHYNNFDLIKSVIKEWKELPCALCQETSFKLCNWPNNVFYNKKFNPGLHIVMFLHVLQSSTIGSSGLLNLCDLNILKITGMLFCRMFFNLGLSVVPSCWIQVMNFWLEHHRRDVSSTDPARCTWFLVILTLITWVGWWLSGLST